MQFSHLVWSLYNDDVDHDHDDHDLDHDDVDLDHDDDVDVDSSPPRQSAAANHSTQFSPLVTT